MHITAKFFSANRQDKETEIPGVFYHSLESHVAAKRSQRRVNTVKTNAATGTCERPRVSQNCWYTLQNCTPLRNTTYVSSTAARAFLSQNPSMKRISKAHFTCGLFIHTAHDTGDAHEQPHTKLPSFHYDWTQRCQLVGVYPRHKRVSKGENIPSERPAAA